MIRFFLVLITLACSLANGFGQYKVYKDEKGQLLTSVDTYGATTIKSTAYNQVVYIGSPFLNYPIWQEGTIQLDRSGKPIACRIAYNMATNEVFCQLGEDSTTKIITPEVFTIDGTEYVRQRNNLLGIDYRLYAKVLHNGPTQLLQSTTKQLEPMNSTDALGNRHNRELNLQGVYRTLTNHYIRKGDARPELISLTKKSLLEAFYDQSEAIAPKIPNGALSQFDVIDVINAYDSLVAAARVGSSPLSQNSLFTQSLHSQIIYPAWVGNQGIYSRVYAGFEIDSQGIVRNVTILSPTNAGFGFAQEVQKALEKLPNLDPTYRGSYVLPVTFTYTNKKEQSGAHVPVNQLPEERMKGRMLLDEFTVPWVVTKPITTTREVWGYYP
ncbi:hypothetical protein WBJ53_11395 [Spirosoma sp. SC4-14]|uniref:hypothetical protein n=1 Tax=Spirosoma sp. SC4-14 TaxID=3128900 RepID=UPI0030D6196B